jgi:hypothetical protein
MWWQIALFGNSACGKTSILFSYYGLAASSGGFMPGNLFAESTGCGFSNSTQGFYITSFVASNGSGKAYLNCEPGCFLLCLGRRPARGNLISRYPPFRGRSRPVQPTCPSIW